MAIRTAILGYGRNGSTMHAGAVEAVDDFRLTAACDIDPARRDQARNRFGCRVFEDYHRMLAEEELDLVVIVTRSDQHCAMACDCLRAGVDVLVTKPWCVDEDEARAMLAARDASGRHLYPWLPARWGADLLRVRERIDQGAVGRVFRVRRVQCSFATRNDWQTLRRHGGGYLLNWGPHVVDTGLLAAGGTPKRVCGHLDQVMNPGDAEDIFFAAITTDTGVLLTAEYTVSPEPLPTWVVQGTRGMITVRGRDLQVVSGAPRQPEDPTAYGGMVGRGLDTQSERIEGALFGDAEEVYRCLAAAMHGRRPFPVTTDDALALTRVLDAIRTAALENRAIMLDADEDRP